MRLRDLILISLAIGIYENDRVLKLFFESIGDGQRLYREVSLPVDLNGIESSVCGEYLVLYTATVFQDVPFYMNSGLCNIFFVDRFVFNFFMRCTIPAQNDDDPPKPVREGTSAEEWKSMWSRTS